MEQKKDTELVERKKGGYRTIPFIIGEDSLISLQNIFLFIHTLKIMVFILLVKYISSSNLQVVVFIVLLLVNETFKKVANVGLHVNIILYFLQEYHFGPAIGAISIFLWNALSNSFPMFGAFLSNSWLGWFCVIALGIVIDLVVSQYYHYIPTTPYCAC